MVTRSTENYQQWKSDVERYYKDLWPKHHHKVDEFMDYISQVYDPVGKAFFSFKLMMYLYGRRMNVINKNQHLWFAIIGKKGGEGKSTLAKQILQFLDPTFNSDQRTSFDYESFLKVVYETKKVKKLRYPGILQDEVDIDVHSLSQLGRKIRNITTRIRQENLFVGVCANSLSDIPPYIYKMINTVIYINDKHRFWVWDENKDPPRFSIVSEIKNLWKRDYHKVFIDRLVTKRAYFKDLSFSPELPFLEQDYEMNKSNDLYERIEEVISPKEEVEEKNISKTELILELHRRNPKLTHAEIARTINASREWVTTVRNRAVKCEAESKYNNNMEGIE